MLASKTASKNTEKASDNPSNQLQINYDKMQSEYASLKQKHEELSNNFQQCVFRIEHVIPSDV